MPKRRHTNKGLSLYNKILKRFTVINNQLPENRKLSLQQRRKIVSDSIYPQLKNKAAKFHTYKHITKRIEGVLEQIPPQELCDPNYISPQLYAIVDWYAIDDFIQNIIPDCIYVKVNAGDYGQTKIFNTRNYNYYKSGVKQIIENLRPLAANSSGLDFSGYQKLRKGKTNDGTPENYYIEFILNINAVPQGDTTVTRFSIPRAERPVQRRVREEIIHRINELKAKKRRKQRARKTTKKNLEEVKRKKQAIRRARSQAGKAVSKRYLLKEFNKAKRALDKDYKNGLFTKEQYERYLKNLLKLL